MANIQISKGAITVTIHTVEVNEEFKNQLTQLPFPQTKQKQDTGPKPTKVIDLLKITHTIQFRGHLNATTGNTAKEEKDNLITMFKGANIQGGPCTVTTQDGDSISAYIESLLITENPSVGDRTQNAVITYNVQLTLVEGVAI